MRILLLTQYFRPEMGAPQSRLYEMLNGLIKEGAEVSVVTAMPNYPNGQIFDNYRGKFSSTEQMESIQVKRFWLYASNSKRALPRIICMLSFSITSLFSFFFCRRFKPDFLIVESPPLTLAITGWLLSLACKCQLVTNISDLWPLSAAELGVISKGVLYRFLEKIERFVYNRSVAVLGQSQEIVDYVSERTKSKVYLFRNGVDYSRFDQLSSSREVNGNRRIVYAGLLGVAQGIRQICEAINFRKYNTEFHIYGAGPEKEEIIHILDNNPGRGIFYKGILTREQIPGILKQYDGALIPLNHMIFGAVPSKIYEAMAAELPIIFSGDGEGAAIIQNNQIGWVSPAGDMSGLELNIEQFSTAEIQDIKKQCKVLAQTKFNRRMQVKALYSFLDGLNQ